MLHFYGDGPPPNPQAGGAPFFGSPRLLIKHIRSCPPYLEAVFSVRNLRAPHAMVTNPLYMGRYPIGNVIQNSLCV